MPDFEQGVKQTRMGAIFSDILIAFAAVTFVLFLNALHGRIEYRYLTRLFAVFCLGSTVWSFFFGILYIQTSTEAAYFCRCIGMVGTFCYLIAGTFLMIYWNGTKSIWIQLVKVVTMSAVVLYPFLMQKGNTIFHMTSFGMTYTFKDSIWNNLYTLYCVLVAVNMVILTVSLYRNQKREWTRIMGKQLLFCEFVIIFGMILDTILPFLGVRAFPGSTVAQFFGTILIYRVLVFYEKNKISLRNVSQFVYYSVESPVLIYDEKGEMQIVNKSAQEFFQLTENVSLESLFEGEFYLTESAEDKRTVDALCKVNGAFCRLGINTIWDEYREVLGYIIIVDDVTDQKESMEELEKARMSAVIANRAKSTFHAQMSHEIRTPLNTVLGMDEMILRESKSEEVLRYANYIKSAGNNLLELINDILDLSKLEEGKVDIIPANYILLDVIRDMVNFESLKIKEKGLKFQVDVARDMPYAVYGDKMRVKQVVTNVLSNAVKYTDTGKIIFRLRWDVLSGTWGDLVFEIEDTGRGISRENQEKIFEPYNRLEQERNQKIPGTGLGLAITRNLLELMGGRIELQSRENVGSKFTIHIPHMTVPEEEQQKLREEKEAGKKQPQNYLVLPEKSVLVVDDNDANLVIMKELLRRTQMTVDTETSGAAALERVRQKKFDLIFLDHMMPEMDGIETLKRMRKQTDSMNQDTPVIALTANAILGAKEMYLEEGFTDYLSKPVFPAELESLIRKYTT